MEVSLIFLNGSDPGRAVALERGEDYTFGSDKSCSITLADRLASHLHARIRQDGDQWRLEDCGSRTGTHLNGRPIQRAVLRPGDLIRFGELLLVFSTDEAVFRDPQPSQLGGDARVGRTFPAQHPLAAERHAESEGPPRKLSHLFRLAMDLHGVPDLPALVSRVLAALRDGVRANPARVWTRGVDGRLQVFSSLASSARDDSLPTLAGWIMERDEAVLIELNEKLPSRAADSPDATGIVMGAPVPGGNSPKAAIECFQTRREREFYAADLAFAISVAQLFGMAWENLEHRRRIEQARRQPSQRLAKSANRMLGKSAPLAQLLEQIALAAPTESTVLVLGESGTGKELVARQIHDSSRRAQAPFVAVNCAAFTDSLLESELFGHEKGSFTGADMRRKGQFERADRGTIFLDEVGELSMACQAKLLRLLEGQPFERVGGAEPIQVDVRIVAATHRNLLEMVQSGGFREDLWYRLRVIELRTPPLRERGEDVVHLATHFFQVYRGETGRGPVRLSNAALDALRRYPWPGNVRELKNAVERAVVLGVEEEVQPGDLGLDSPASTCLEPSCRVAPAATLADNERRHIQGVLEMVGGNKSEACRILGIGRATLYSKLSRLLT